VLSGQAWDVRRSILFNQAVLTLGARIEIPRNHNGGCYASSAPAAGHRFSREKPMPL
jgi:hypothetical protein